MIPPCNQNFLNYKGRFRYCLKNKSIAKAAAHFWVYVNTFFELLQKKRPLYFFSIEIFFIKLNLMTLGCKPRIFYALHLPEAPHGRTSLLAVTGSPISELSTEPPCSGIIMVDIMYVRTAGASPVVYEFMRKKSGSSESS